jgi:hypothetical protein
LVEDGAGLWFFRKGALETDVNYFNTASSYGDRIPVRAFFMSVKHVQVKRGLKIYGRLELKGVIDA